MASFLRGKEATKVGALSGLPTRAIFWLKGHSAVFWLLLEVPGGESLTASVSQDLLILGLVL